MERSNMFGIRMPSKKAFEQAKDFILKHPTASQKEYLRKFTNQFGDKISAKNFAEVLVRLFDALEG